MINGEMSMRKRTKYMIEVLLFALSLLTGILGCIQRTGTLYCDTEVSSKVGIRTLCNGASFFGEGYHHSVLSVSIRGFLTLRAILFSWWWDTLCIPYDIYLKFDGVNFYVYDQDGKPIPDVLISACGTDSFFWLEKKTDATGRFYYPRRVNSFELFAATKDGYWVVPQETWLKQAVKSGLPPMLREEFRGHAVTIPTTNSLHSLNVFMKKIPQPLPVADSYHLVVSNVVSGVEYGIDLSKAELCAPFGAGKYADVKLRLIDEESPPRIRSSLNMEYENPDVLHMSVDGCNKWPYFYYAPPLGAFDKVVEPGNMKMPALVKLTGSTSRYAIVKTCRINRFRLHGTPACIYLRYWNLDVLDNGVLVCDYWSRKIDKVVVPVTKDTIREDNERLKKQRDNVNGSVDTNLEPKR